jgi:hypothetical protein
VYRRHRVDTDEVIENPANLSKKSIDVEEAADQHNCARANMYDQ